MHYYIRKILNKQEHQEIAFNHQILTFLYKKFTEKVCSSLLIYTILASDNPLFFRKNLLERI